MTSLPLLLALSVGFAHAFEADHLVAVSTIVTRRGSIWLALKDGVYWGLGHTSTILLVGSIFIFSRFALHEETFRYLEAGIGVMLVGLGAARLYQLRPSANQPVADADGFHSQGAVEQLSAHRLSYGVGLLHGLAGSGALILSVLTQMKGIQAGLLYLLLFGVGSIGGMMVAAGAFSMPFSTRFAKNKSVRTALILASAVFCILLGTRVIFANVG